MKNLTNKEILVVAGGAKGGRCGGSKYQKLMSDIAKKLREPKQSNPTRNKP